MLRTAPLIVMLGLVSEACAFSRPPSQMAHWSQLTETEKDSTGRCDYALEGALGLGAGVAVLSIIKGRPAEQLAVLVPIGAGLGWLWGRYLMPPRARCRPSGKGTGDPDSTPAPRDSGA